MTDPDPYTARERFEVESVPASEIEAGQEVVIVEFRGVVDVVRTALNSDGRTWIELASDEGAELTNDCPVLRVVPVSSERLFADVRTVVEWKGGGETIYDHNASVKMEEMADSPVAPKSWHVERRKVTNWTREGASDDHSR
jgi:hypothetical protein